MNKTPLILIAAALACAFGCGKEKGAEPPPEKINIEGGLRKTFPVLDRTITMEYMRQINLGFQASPGAPPRTIEELEQVHASNKITKAILDGSLVVVLGVDPERQPRDAILAYQAEPDAKGERVVLTCGGNVQVMDTTTFEAAPKAKGNNRWRPPSGRRFGPAPPRGQPLNRGTISRAFHGNRLRQQSAGG